MRLAPAFLASALVVLTHLPVSARPACAASALRLNEILAGPARDWNGDGTISSRDDEWIEIYNTGGIAESLDGFLVLDGDSLVRIALTGMLGSGERHVVYGKDAYDWERANGYPAFGLSLGNTGDRVTLWQVVGAETLLVDAWNYTSHQAGSDRSVGRLPDGGAWSLFDALNPYGGTSPPTGNGCAPTPGAPNVCGSTSARNTTWGVIKAAYR